MKLSQIKEFFNRSITTAVLKESILNEVANFKASSIKGGGSASIILTEDIPLRVEKSDIANLCEAYIDSELSESEISYIMDALLLSDQVEFENEELKEVSETLTDPTVNGKLTKDTAMEVLRYCKS